MSRDKKASIIALITIFAMAISLIASVQTTNAQTVDRPTYAFLAARPNPIGVGQTALITMFIDVLPREAYGTYTDVWHDFTLTITKPDGTVETKVMDSDPVAAQWLDYTPTETGTYTLKFTFPGETVGDRNYLTSTAPLLDLVVQDEAIPHWPAAPLPTQYWERPIDGQNREWDAIADNWYGLNYLFGNCWGGSSNWAPYTSAPNSAHILWTREKDLGGMVGGSIVSTSMYPGGSYENKWSPPVILNGVLFHNQRLGSSANLGCEAVDMDTGERLWFHEGMSISFGQTLEYDSPNQHGAIDYLWRVGGTYTLYDPFTGLEILQIENASTGRYLLDEHGNLITYSLNGNANTLIKWNSTKCILAYSPYFATPGDEWRPRQNGVLDWSAGIEWNKTVPDVPGRQSLCSLDENTLIAAASPAVGVIGIVGYSAEDGHQLWEPFNVTSAETATYFVSAPLDGVFTWFKQEEMRFYGYDANTGRQLWVTDPYTNAWGLYTSSVNGLGASSPVLAYGNLYSVAYDGMIHCYDLQTGENLWNYYVGSAGFETPYGTWPFGGGLHVVADGKVYATTGEHSPTIPLMRGAKIVCVNATTGDEIWRSQGWMESPVISDGRLVAFNFYDLRIYCFGKGPSATTVTAPDTAVTVGEPLVIRGTVMDKSVGTMQSEPAGRLPSGVPAVSDDSQFDWMAFVYMDQPMPINATGVEVMIDVFDSNGNYRNIGTTTSDTSGFFTFTWEPDIPGDFRVVATFAGSESYWPSYAETSFTAVEPVVTPAPTPEPASMTDTYVLGIGAAAIVAIIVIGLIIILMLRRR